MPKKKEIDSKALIKMIDGGAEQKDVMKKLAISEFPNQYYDRNTSRIVHL